MAFSERVVVLSGAVLLPTTVLAATEVTTEEGLLTARETGGEIQLAAGQTARQRQSRGKGNRAACFPSQSVIIEIYTSFCLARLFLFP